MALFSADDITYPPLDVPKPVADGIWIIDSGPLRVFGLLGLPIRMTVLRLSSGDMLMHSPTPFDARLKAEIEAHGPIRHLVAPTSRRVALLPVSLGRTNARLLPCSHPHGARQRSASRSA